MTKANQTILDRDCQTRLVLQGSWSPGIPRTRSGRSGGDRRMPLLLTQPNGIRRSTWFLLGSVLGIITLGGSS